MLPREDLVELEGRERLPSPQELQGKIILKGSYKRSEVLCMELLLYELCDVGEDERGTLIIEYMQHLEYISTMY